MKDLNELNDIELSILLYTEDIAQSLCPTIRAKSINTLNYDNDNEYSVFIKFNDEVNFLCDIDNNKKNYEINLNEDIPAIKFVSNSGNVFIIFLKKKNDKL